MKGKFPSCSLHREVREEVQPESSPLELADKSMFSSRALQQAICNTGARPLLLQLNCALPTSSLDSMCASFHHTNLLICILQPVVRYEMYC